MRLQTALAVTFTITLVALLVVSPMGVIGASAAQTADAHAQTAPADPQQIVTIQLADNGDATWTIESRFLLEDNETEEFETFAEAVASGERDVGYDSETFERFVDVASDSVDREMAIEDAGWNDHRIDTELVNETDDATDETETTDEQREQQIGVVSYTFTWTNFTDRDGNEILLGDVFRSGDGTWFPSLLEGQQLVIEYPPGYGYGADQSLTVTDGNLVWDGPHEFDLDDLTVIYVEGASPVPPNGGDEPVDPPENESSLPQAMTGLALLVLLAVVAGGGYYLANAARSSDPDEAGESATASGDTGTESTVDSWEPARSSELEYDDEAIAGTTTAYDEEDVDEEVDVELLSDEERVHRMLRENNGRMKQATIVKETGWSNAKVSQLLSKMDDDDEIEKLRIGRENLITLPEVDLTEID